MYKLKGFDKNNLKLDEQYSKMTKLAKMSANKLKLADAFKKLKTTAEAKIMDKKNEEIEEEEEPEEM